MSWIRRQSRLEAPSSFAAFRSGPSSRTPLQLLARMGDLFVWALAMANGAPKWDDATPENWPDECERFAATLRAFDDALASDAETRYELARLFQGSVADALTHAGLFQPRRKYQTARDHA